MPKPSTYRFDTLALHCGRHPDAAIGARAIPEAQTVVLEGAGHALLAERPVLDLLNRIGVV